MNDNDAFLRQLADRPDDLDTLLVYADWLDDAGQADRAEFLRLQQRLLGMRQGEKGQASLRRQLLRLGKKLPRDWLAVVSRPRLENTCWAARPRGGVRYVFRYLPEGVLNYTSPTGTFQNGTWRQVGPHVVMEMNRHYADYEGLFAAGSIRGSARNITGSRWRWTVKRTTDPKLCDLGKPIRTIFDDHLREGRGRRRRRADDDQE